MKALIVDDSSLNIKVACKLLEKENVEVDSVLSGKECLDKIKNNNYDVIFMDIMMPEMDGVETLKKLKEQDSFNIPVIALTADVVAGAEEKYLGLGFFAYIPKPINLELLRSILDKVKLI